MGTPSSRITMTGATILERLDRGEVIVGDGSYLMVLEKRGYVKAGNWTPEACVENPRAVKQLGLDYARAGADVTQTCTFFAKSVGLPEDCSFTCEQINEAACGIAKAVAEEKGTLVAGAINHTAVFKKLRDKAEVQKELGEALKTIVEHIDVDFLIFEFFEFIEEMEWAIEHGLSYGKPVAATMCIGPNGDHDGVEPGECAVRMARAGANILGVNCCFDPATSLETISKMKLALDKEDLHPHLMLQPNAFKVPDGGVFGMLDLPEYPYALEPRLVTRFEAKQWAREAYQLGVRYIGGCCGFEPYLARAIGEELAVERKCLPHSSRKSDVDLSLWSDISSRQDRHAGKGTRQYWDTLTPCTGRPLSAPLCRQPDPQIVSSSVLK